MSCSEETKYEYAGKGEHWKAVYNYELKQDKKGNEQASELIITYTGDSEELFSIKEVTYSYEANLIKGKKTLEIDESNFPLVIRDENEGINGPVLNGKEIITLTILWGDYQESIELFYVEK